MFRILMAVDGSESSDRAVSHLLKKLAWYKDAIEIHLLNVQAPLPERVARAVPGGQLDNYHRENGEAALASARAIFDAAKVPYATHIGVGEPAHVIVGYAKERSIDQIVMGTRGLGTVTGMVLGSVTTKVLSLAEVPVLRVKYRAGPRLLARA
jgi:nucleotide-binding universal stress UspA family protein